MEELNKLYENKKMQYEILKKKTEKDIWKEDLSKLKQAYTKCNKKKNKSKLKKI